MIITFKIRNCRIDITFMYILNKTKMSKKLVQVYIKCLTAAS